MKKLLVLCLLAAIPALSNVSTLSAADNPSAPVDKTEKSDKKPRHIPFHGKVDTLDKAAGTLKIGERTFHVTSGTKITKAGKPASIGDAVVGEEVGGAYLMGESGRLEVMSLRIGPKPAKDPKPEDAKP
jgi:hypothetical protein